MSDTGCLQLSPAGSVPALTVTLTPTPSAVGSGDQIVWTAVVANSGTSTASNLTITDTLNLTWSPAGPYSINAGQSQTVTAIYTTSGPDAVAGHVADTVTATGTGSSGQTISASSATRTVTVSAVSAHLCQPWRADALCGTFTPRSQTGHVVTFASQAEFDTKKTSLVPGDIFTATANITGRCYLRGNLGDGTGSSINGVDGNHITITSAPGVVFTNPSLVDGAIDVGGCRFVDVLNNTIDGSQFGIRYYAVTGGASSHCRIAGNTVRNTTDAHIAVQAWFTTPWTESVWVDVICNHIYGQHSSQRSPWWTEGIYLGHGTPRWVDISHDIGVYGNHIHDIFSDGIEVKPGVTSVIVEDNLLHDLNFIAGPSGDAATAAITVWYQDVSGGTGGGALTPPSFLTGANVRVRRNRIYNLSGINSGLRPIIVGYGGVDIESNIAWGYPNAMTRLQSEQAYAPSGNTPQAITYAGNTGSLAGFQTVNTSGATLPVVASQDNIPDQFPTALFIGPTTGSADAGGQGPGSGFILRPGQNLVGSFPTIDATGCAKSGSYPPGALTTSGSNAITSFGGATASNPPAGLVGTALTGMDTNHTVTTADFNAPPANGNKILFVILGPSPNDVTNFSVTTPALTILKLAPGSGYNPFVDTIWTTYTGSTTSWTFSSAAEFRVAGLIFSNVNSLAASAAPSYGISPQDPGPVAITAGGLGLVVVGLDFTGAQVTAPPTGHTTMIDGNAATGYRQIYIAGLQVTNSGTYDPPAPTIGPPPNSENVTTFAISLNP